MLHLHRSNRADGLVEALREVISVPTRGMERWITQQLSLRLGICANVDFPIPRRLVASPAAVRRSWLPGRVANG